MSIHIAAFSGSLRKESYTTKLVHAFRQLAPADVTVELVDISQLPLLNQDLENELPKSVQELHAAIQKADGILLATPEYNRSYSPVLKNALDWGSRPEGNNAWKGKPGVVLGCTPYNLGGFGAVHHLRQVLTYLDIRPLQQPEFYLSGAGEKFNDKGELTDARTQKLITTTWTAFIDWIGRLKN